MSPACSPRPGRLLSPVEREGGSSVGPVPAVPRTPQTISLSMGLKAAALRGPKASQAFCSSHGQGAGVWAAGLAFDLQEPGAEPRVRVPFSRPLAHGSLEQAEAPLSSPGKLRPREGKGLAQGCPESGAEPGGECGLQGPRPGLLTSPVPWRGDRKSVV